MNIRIKKLAEQATTDITDEFANWIGSDFDKEKFAMLIVEECLKQCSKNFAGAVGTYPGAFNTGVKRCVDSIREHFDYEK